MIKNNVILGFDISTTCIGLSLFDEVGNFLELRHIKLDVSKNILPEDRYLNKADIFSEYLTFIKDKYNVIKIIVEDPLQSSNNKFTVNALLRFNGICCYILYKLFNISPIFIPIHDIRRALCPELLVVKSGKSTLSFKSKNLDPKEYIFSKINTLYPVLANHWLYNTKGNLKSENYDMTDAMAVSLAYLLINNIIQIQD
jgi:hypothetical protein